MMLALGVSYVAFIMFRNIPSSPSFFKALIMKACWILKRPFLHLLGGKCVFLSLLQFTGCIMFMDLCVWTILECLEYNWLCHGLWSLWCVVKFYFPVFSWESLHLYSLKTMIYHSLFWLQAQWVSEWV
jgi:hypothetical protein